MLICTHGAEFAKKQTQNVKVEELENGVLVKNLGFLLQGGGESHALVKLNITNLALETEMSCSGVDMIEKFVKDKHSYKKKVVLNELDPLVDTLKDICSYTKYQLENLVATFRLHQEITEGSLNNPEDRDKRAIGAVIVGSVVGTLASSVF